jgi:hypothetical protein
VHAVGAGQADIPNAAKQCCCASEEVIRLILDRKRRLTSERGHMSVLVDVEEIRALVRGPDHGGFTSVALKDRLQTTDRVARALMAHGHLKTVNVINPVNRCPTVIVLAQEVERFEREYLSLFALARQLGRHLRKVKKELDAAGVRPALDAEKIGATFYRRAEARRAGSAKAD